MDNHAEVLAELAALAVEYRRYKAAADRLESRMRAIAVRAAMLKARQWISENPTPPNVPSQPLQKGVSCRTQPTRSLYMPTVEDLVGMPE